MDVSKLSIAVDAEKAIEAMDRLTQSVERAKAALEGLSNHGGVSVSMVGEVVEIEVKPAA